MCRLGDTEIYPEDDPFAINNYGIGYQDYFGFGGRTEKTYPVAPENESYMRGWFAARSNELGKKVEHRVNPLYAQNRAIKAEAKRLYAEWEKLAKANGWNTNFPL